MPTGCDNVLLFFSIVNRWESEECGNKIRPQTHTSELAPREMDMVIELAYVRMLRFRSDVCPGRSREMSERDGTVSSGPSGGRRR